MKKLLALLFTLSTMLPLFSAQPAEVQLMAAATREFSKVQSNDQQSIASDYRSRPPKTRRPKKADRFPVVILLIGGILVAGLIFLTFFFMGKIASLFLRILLGIFGIGLALVVGAIFFITYLYANPAA